MLSAEEWRDPTLYGSNLRGLISGRLVTISCWNTELAKSNLQKVGRAELARISSCSILHQARDHVVPEQILPLYIYCLVNEWYIQICSAFDKMCYLNDGLFFLQTCCFLQLGCRDNAIQAVLPNFSCWWIVDTTKNYDLDREEWCNAMSAWTSTLRCTSPQQLFYFGDHEYRGWVFSPSTTHNSNGGGSRDKGNEQRVPIIVGVLCDLIWNTSHDLVFCFFSLCAWRWKGARSRYCGRSDTFAPQPLADTCLWTTRNFVKASNRRQALSLCVKSLRVKMGGGGGSSLLPWGIP